MKDKFYLLLITALFFGGLLTANAQTAEQCLSCSDLGETECGTKDYCDWDDGEGVLNLAECHANLTECNNYCWLWQDDDPDEIICKESKPECLNTLIMTQSGPSRTQLPSCGEATIDRYCATYIDTRTSGDGGTVRECRYNSFESCTDWCATSNCTEICVIEGSQADEERDSCTSDDFKSTVNTTKNLCVDKSDPEYNAKVSEMCEGGDVCVSQCSTCDTLINSGNPSNGTGSISGRGLSAAFELDGFKPFQDVENLYNVEGETNTLPQFINTFLGFVIGLTGAVVVVMIVVGGFSYVTAAATSSKAKGRELISNALLGLLLLLGAVAILNTINPQLLNLQALKPIPITITQEEFDKDSIFSPNYSGGGSGVGGTAGSAGRVGQWKDQMIVAANENDLTYCMMEALLSTESAGNADIASTITNCSGSPKGVSTPIRNLASAPPDSPAPGHYGMTFSRDICHAIGLLQVTIYSPGKWGGSPIPARPESELSYGGTRSLTVAMLIDPQTNISVGSKYFKWIMDRYAGGDPVVAYNGYNRGPANATKSLLEGARKYHQYHEACKARQ